MLRKAFIGALLCVICGLPLGLVTGVPRPDRRYGAEHEVLAVLRVTSRELRVHRARAFRYGVAGGATAAYYDARYDLDAVRRVWYGLSPFGSWRGPAHAFVSFEFADSRFLSISVEARREPGERYSPWLGMLRRYELIYVVGDEPDVIGSRAVAKGEPVYLYPGRATPAQAARLLETLLRRAAELQVRPEYYHTLANNCATNLADAVNAITPGRVPWNRALVLPGFSDEFAYRLGLLALAKPPAEVRGHYRVEERARAAYGAQDFSTAIRQGLGRE